MAIEQFSNLAQNLLASPISSGATSLTVVDPSTFPTQGNFRVIIDQEIFLVTAVSGATFTCVPGQENSTQASHAANALVTVVYTAYLQTQNYAAQCLANSINSTFSGAL